ncbi:peptide/nickel transport system ATP-binding protein [Planomicrobium soli]|uniref:Peptide/nickel transport system ATP-binding protein n=1 Tax=Planomicrobium soli TaxID=1176648 RepID=A0A2P8H1G7_9BACL|nr:dipeptide/oligopeptide/nickel ABC transporter ATP-binding protein [Planomicrobium soli]PSL40063.1 peptide/nickel transport system ATP-binding protein [Planomicrobium soli]
MSLLELKNVSKTYDNGEAVLKGINFSLEKKECVGLVGESGCGKSTLARCILQLASIDEGEILLNGTALHNKNERKLKPYRRNIQTVMQNPTASLNPKLKIRESLLDPYLQYGSQAVLKHFHYTNETKFVKQLMEAVELPEELAGRYPHELSGGQKQRVTIARAISLEPALVVLDEPTSSLDILSQSATLKLLNGLRQQLELSYLFISHDLSAVNMMSQKILVMKEGSIVDRFEQEELFSESRHDYTKELISLYQ